jgi:hypothetical protein
VLDLDPDLAAHIVDRLFGGPGEAAGARRALTGLEQHVLGNLTGRAMALLAEAWAEWVELTPTQRAFESVPELLQIVSREEDSAIFGANVRGNIGWKVCTTFGAFKISDVRHEESLAGWSRGFTNLCRGVETAGPSTRNWIGKANLTAGSG